MQEIQWFSSLGVGGILAGIVFYFYRVDRKSSEQTMRQMVSEVIKVAQSTSNSQGALVTLVEELTERLDRAAQRRPK